MALNPLYIATQGFLSTPLLISVHGFSDTDLVTVITLLGLTKINVARFPIGF